MGTASRRSEKGKYGRSATVKNSKAVCRETGHAALLQYAKLQNAWSKSNIPLVMFVVMMNMRIPRFNHPALLMAAFPFVYEINANYYERDT